MTARRIRVLQVITRLVTRGVPRHVLNLATHLDPERFDVEVLAGEGLESEGSLWPEALSKGVVTHRLTALQREINPRKDMAALWGISRTIRRGSFDVIHTHISKAGILGRLAANWAGIPTVHTYHGNVEELERSSPSGRAYLACERRAARSTTALLAISEGVREHLLRLKIGRPEQYRVVPNGIDVSAFAAQTNTPSIHRVWRQGTHPTIGCVGSLTREKGVDVLLQAVPRIAERFQDLSVVIVGDGPLRNELERQARTLGIEAHVTFVGVSEDVRSWLSKFDVSVVSSRREGQSIALVEAMASGNPVVATRVGGVPEVLDNGAYGVLVEPEDPEALATAINLLLADVGLRQGLGKLGRQAVERNYSVQRMTKQVAQVYEEVCATAQRPEEG